MTLPALNFPPTPVVGQLYPDPPVTGQPQYMWNGTMWLASKAAITQSIRLDALGWSGMQINGSMEVSQERGNVATTVFGSWVCDNWLMYTPAGGGGTAVISAATISTGGFLPGLPNHIAVTIITPQATLTGTQFASILQNIEGYRFSRLGWGTPKAQPLTVGFWTGHNRTGLYSVAFRNKADDRSYVATYTQNVADTWEYKTITIPGDTAGTWLTNNDTGLRVGFAQACGPTYTAPAANTWYGATYVAAPGQVNAVAATSDAFRITGVVVLPGIDAPTVAQSPLIMRPYDQELLTCMRYWERGSVGWDGYTQTNVPYSTTAWYKVVKRAAPTIVQTHKDVAGFPVAFNLDPSVPGPTLGFKSHRIANTIIAGNFSEYWTADARL